MNNVKKILVGLVSSLHSHKDVDYAINLAELEDAKLLLVHAIGDLHDKEMLWHLGQSTWEQGNNAWA